MKILKVIHGYPPRYSAGSEVYSQILVQQLAKEHEVQVFTRQENSFLPDYAYTIERDSADPRIIVHLINIPHSKYRDKYIHHQVDDKFMAILTTFKPDIVHFGHLNHLSFNLPQITKDLHIPSVFTLHDFWLMCPRGQFIQRNAEVPWALCDGQDDTKCATQCYKGSFSGEENNYLNELTYWRNWIHNRMQKAYRIIDVVDHFIAPSQFLRDKFIDEFALPVHKVSFLDYGFNLQRLSGRKRVQEPTFVFGYIGTHTPQKGIHHLITAFTQLTGTAILRIWGTPKEDTAALKAIAAAQPESAMRIEWMGGYDNNHIVDAVFNHVDAIVVPSIWGENSPLVIHEAQQVGVTVITADYGGMREYVQHMQNGLLFDHRNVEDLTQKMQLCVDDPDRMKKLAYPTGYLYSTNKHIPDIVDHMRDIEKIYRQVWHQSHKNPPVKPGPWRITFDTNPDHCNYQCVMCEVFSPYSDVKKERVAQSKGKAVMPIQTIEKVLAESVGTPLREIIPSTMGEPLLYKDFERIIALCHQYNIKLNLTTNGSFPGKGVEKWAELLLPVLSDIKISWNGATKQTHEKIMLGSQWEQALSHLKIFIALRDQYAAAGKSRCTVTLQLTFLEDNYAEIKDIVKLAIGLGVDRVKGHHLWAHFDQIKDQSMRRSKAAITRWNHEINQVLEIVRTEKLASGASLILDNITLLDENAVEDLAPGGACPFLGKEAWINTKGQFNPCCAPDNLRKSLGTFGTVTESPLHTIWESVQYNDLRKNYLNHALCQGCNMRKPLE